MAHGPAPSAWEPNKSSFVDTNPLCQGRRSRKFMKKLVGFLTGGDSTSLLAASPDLAGKAGLQDRQLLLSQSKSLGPRPWKKGKRGASFLKSWVPRSSESIQKRLCQRSLVLNTKHCGHLWAYLGRPGLFPRPKHVWSWAGSIALPWSAFRLIPVIHTIFAPIPIIPPSSAGDLAVSSAPNGCGSKKGTQNGTLVNGTKD